jgi:hypothetical protein
MNIANLDKFISSHGLTQDQIELLAAKLATMDEAKYAYRPFWSWFLSEQKSDLGVPGEGTDWKQPVYAVGIGLWLDICKLNKWN